MFAILRGAHGRRHEVDFHDDPVTVDVAMSASTVMITMTTAGSSCRGYRRGIQMVIQMHVIEALAGDWRRLDERIEGLSADIETPVQANGLACSFARIDEPTRQSDAGSC
jgi:hypothetical protein